MHTPAAAAAGEKCFRKGAPLSKNLEMQASDDFLSFFGLMACTFERSQLRKELESRDIQSSYYQGNSEEEDRASSPTTKSSARHDSRSKESERPEITCEWIF